MAHTTTTTATTPPQSVQKKSGQPSFKTLDSTIQTRNRDTGKKEAITYRCADINSMVPNLMTVSKVCWSLWVWCVGGYG